MDKVKVIAEQLGLGQKYDIGIGGLLKGIVPNPAWKKSKIGTTWRTGDSLNAAIGQGLYWQRLAACRDDGAAC